MARAVAAVRVLLTPLALFAAALAFAPDQAQAIPSFARQTGQPCAACHTAFPELTPFGRRFKLSGYTMQGGDAKLPPVALMLMPSFTHSEAPYDAGAQPAGTRTNDNVVTQQITGLYGGQIYGDIGAFGQLSANPISGQVWFDATDVRYAHGFQLFGQDAIFGITANNTPGVQDVWNTTPAWSFPQIVTPFAPTTVPLTHIEGSWGQQVLGAGAYVFWNDMVYAELTGYFGPSKSTLQTFGETLGDGLQGVAPYWRLALEPHWGDHYLMFGTFGMYGQVLPGLNIDGYTPGSGTDNFLDVGFDSQYQYDGDKYSVTVKLTDIIEKQTLNSTFFTGGSQNAVDHLNSFKANASFVWDHTYSFTAGYFNVAGSTDNILYGPAGSGLSANSSPNGNGLIFDAAYLPFSHGSPWPYSSYNARIGVQYIKYLQMYGGTTNFDGSGLGGTHNASGNNTLFLYAWTAF